MPRSASSAPTGCSGATAARGASRRPRSASGRTRSVAELLEVSGTAAVFAHGHLLRVLAARWLGLEPFDGRHFGLGTATLSRLGWEHDYRVVQRWNAPV